MEHQMNSTQTINIKSAVVKTASGTVQGEVRNGVVRFLGIPYAQSIAGKNRFAPPKPVTPWQGVRKALSYADDSPQQPSFISTPVTPAFEPPAYVRPGDDCLALNVWTPRQGGEGLPVMVWLHGGGWTSGSGSCAIYDGENLAGRKDVVVATINHRLGASGLADFSRVLGGLFADSSNLAIRDIIAALTWVHDNISAFGGSPDLVTIFGESGGGWKTATLLGVPSAKGLFHRAIIQSGPLTHFMTPEQADAVANAFLSELGITADTADKLNHLTCHDVMTAEAQVLAAFPMSMQAPGFPTGFWPVIDQDIIPGHVFDSKDSPISLDVPLLIGQNGTEFSLFMLADKAAYALDKNMLAQRVAKTFGDAAASKILDTYWHDFPDYNSSTLWFHIFSDYCMGALTSHIMDVRSVPGAAPVFAYRFDWTTPILGGKLYSPHTIEIPFVFDNTSTEAGKVMTGTEQDTAAIADIVSRAWVEFARTGKPAAAGLPEWPAYTVTGRESMHIDTTSRVSTYMNPSMVDFFHDMLWTRAGLK